MLLHVFRIVQCQHQGAARRDCHTQPSPDIPWQRMASTTLQSIFTIWVLAHALSSFCKPAPVIPCRLNYEWVTVKASSSAFGKAHVALPLSSLPNKLPAAWTVFVVAVKSALPVSALPQFQLDLIKFCCRTQVANSVQICVSFVRFVCWQGYSTQACT